MTEYEIDRTTNVLRSGVAKIIAHVSAGVYTITEQWRTAGGANQNATAPVGRVNISAREINAIETGAADDIVRFWESQKIDGTIETLIVTRLPASLVSTKRAIVKDFWFDITGNMAIAMVDDSIDYRNRIIKSMAFWDAGSPVDGGSMNEANVSVYDLNEVARAQDNPGGECIGRWVYSNPSFGITNLILFVNRGGGSLLGDFKLYVDQDTGELHGESTNFNLRYQVRCSLQCGEQKSSSDAITIS